MSGGALNDQKIEVRPATEGDLEAIARINAQVFLGQRDRLDVATHWVRARANFCDGPEWRAYYYYVITVDNEVAGYIGWEIYGGFLRANPAVELEQLGIDPRSKSRGLGTQLTQATMELMHERVCRQNSRIEGEITFFVWVYADNAPARTVYERMLGGDGEPARVIGEREIFQGRKEVAYGVSRPWRKFE